MNIMVALAVAGYSLLGSRLAVGQGAVNGELLSLFERHPMVGFCELHHDRKLHEFLRGLIRDPRFASTVRDIVVEFGNARYQPVVDRYESGGRVSRKELEKVWRETGQFMAWDVPEYPEFFRAIRQANRRLPRDRQIRVHLGDPPIDWSSVRTAADYMPYANRDTFFFRQVDSLLASGRRGLVVIGGTHLFKRDVRGPGASSPEKLPPLAERYGSKLFVVWTVTGPSSLGAPAVYPSYAPVSGQLASASSLDLIPRGVQFLKKVDGQTVAYRPDRATAPKLGDVVDAVLFVSADKVVDEPGKDVLEDKAYVKELRRRAPILKAVFGVDFSVGG